MSEGIALDYITLWAVSAEAIPAGLTKLGDASPDASDSKQNP